MVPEGARWYRRVPGGARWYRRVPEGTRGCQRVPDGTGECQRVPDGTRGCQVVSEGAKGYQIIQKDTRGCQKAPVSARGYQRMPDGAKGCQMVSDGSKGCQMVQESTREGQNGSDGANGCQMVPEEGKGCQKDQVGPVVVPGLGEKTDLIFVTVSIAGVEVVALVDTGATMSCCRWEWYQQWKDHLGAVKKSKIRVMGIAPDPVQVKGLTKPLTLLWDGVGGRFQLVFLPPLHDVDVVLGVDVLSWLNVQFDWERQVVRPYREPSIPVESGRNIGLLLENPDSTFKGKIPVKEEGVKEIAKDMLRPTYQDIRYCYKAREKKEDRKIVWNQADYKVQLQEDLEDIWQKLCQVSGKELAKKKATRPVNRMEEGVSVDLCEQRSGERGSGCYAPEEIYKSHTLANVFYNSSEGFSTPVTSPLMPPKPARTERRHYSWRYSGKREVCMCIRILDPLELRNNHKKESMDERSMNYREAEYLFPIKGKGMMTSWIHDVTIQEQHGKASLDTLVAKQYKHSQVRSRPSDSIGFRKAVQYYNKMAAIITVCFVMIIQLLEGFSYFVLRKLKSTIGNSGRDSVDEGMWRWWLFVYVLLECLPILWRYKHITWLMLIIDGLWRRNKALSSKDKGICQLTFRLVIISHWLRNLLLGNVCERNVCIRTGNTGYAFVAGNVNSVYLCPYSDLWASCPIYLCRDMEILGFQYKISSFRVLIYLYIRKFLSFRLSRKQASFFLAFPIKSCTLVYFGPVV